MSGADVHALLRGRLAERAPRMRCGDRLVPASVLVPLFAREPDGAAHVWLLRRPDRMRVHGGQVALPGGKRDRSDASLLDTALREADEEIGLPGSSVEVLGRLDDFVTVTGFVITPFVGWIAGPFEPRPAPGEVARVFCAPVSLFERRGKAKTLLGKLWRRVVLSYDVDGEVVWGATAAILRGLGELVGQPRAGR